VAVPSLVAVLRAGPVGVGVAAAFTVAVPRAATIGVAVARGPSAVRRAAAPTARMPKGPGRPGRERRDQEPHEANASSFHDAAMPPQLGLDGLAFVRGLTPGGSAGGSARADGMGLAAALGEAKASAATVGAS